LKTLERRYASKSKELELSQTKVAEMWKLNEKQQEDYKLVQAETESLKEQLKFRAHKAQLDKQKDLDIINPFFSLQPTKSSRHLERFATDYSLAAHQQKYSTVSLAYKKAPLVRNNKQEFFSNAIY
jgi:vancomycin resistance protein YoaR